MNLSNFNNILDEILEIGQYIDIITSYVNDINFIRVKSIIYF